SWKATNFFWKTLEQKNAFFSSTKFKPAKKGKVETGAVLTGKVFIGKNSLVKNGSRIEGPAFIGENCVVGPGAFIRPYSFISNKCVVGNSSEVKNSLMLSGSAAPHFNYVGDSVVGQNVNLGGGTILANYRFDAKPVKVILAGGLKVSSGTTKLGCFIGANSKTGANVTINPGIIIGKNCLVYPGLVVKKNLRDNAVLKD
ncbi:glucose-1-phosphate thymidylyltransferase, partial [Candidatus Micrarchaeota archaeon]|nr:glucose-1-phosphate thymidylyltransferase [Candidatus Micrarchaeota archaeon]